MKNEKGVGVWEKSRKGRGRGLFASRSGELDSGFSFVIRGGEVAAIGLCGFGVGKSVDA